MEESRPQVSIQNLLLRRVAVLLVVINPFGTTPDRIPNLVWLPRALRRQFRLGAGDADSPVAAVALPGLIGSARHPNVIVAHSAEIGYLMREHLLDQQRDLVRGSAGQLFILADRVGAGADEVAPAHR